ncbi:hypothetical protein RHGRI_002264 [Rhododendron griersonianum]|uniref:AMP-dependent synthetase/ligase domain-containing protein n=1 Tax=Rhododendron griersonianum TaxID=479676 RepID=A0AAV6LNX8_9ERIC|nr:hypothetical protein RHGRI_002264 [Rhododendron griersonianum]
MEHSYFFPKAGKDLRYAEEVEVSRIALENQIAKLASQTDIEEQECQAELNDQNQNYKQPKWRCLVMGETAYTGYLALLCSCPKFQTSQWSHSGVPISPRPPLLPPIDPNLSMISFLFRNSSSYSDKPALIDTDSGQTLTFSQFKSNVAKLSHAFLHQLGIKKNDVVFIYSPNSIQFPICFFVIIAIGAIATTVNPAYIVSEIAKQVNDCKPKVIVTVPELWDKVKGFGLNYVMIGNEKNSNLICISSSSKVTWLTDLVKDPGSVSDLLPVAEIKSSDTAALLYSSGTTGLSKGVVLTHRNFVASALMVTADQELAGEMNLLFLCVLPMFHVFELAVIMYARLQRGDGIVSMAKFDLEMFLRAVKKYRVTHLWVVPPIVLALAKNSVVRKYDVSSVRQIACGTAPLGKDSMAECVKNFPQAVVIHWFWLAGFLWSFGFREGRCAEVSVVLFHRPRWVFWWRFLFLVVISGGMVAAVLGIVGARGFIFFAGFEDGGLRLWEWGCCGVDRAVVLRWVVVGCGGVAGPFGGGSSLLVKDGDGGCGWVAVGRPVVGWSGRSSGYQQELVPRAPETVVAAARLTPSGSGWW